MGKKLHKSYFLKLKKNNLWFKLENNTVKVHYALENYQMVKYLILQKEKNL
jgi:hypothetical protein